MNSSKSIVGSFEFNGTRVLLKTDKPDSWVLNVWNNLGQLSKAEREEFDNIDEAVRAFEQTTRGIFFQCKRFPISSPHPSHAVFDENLIEHVFDNTDCGLLTLPYVRLKPNYDICVTKDTIIYIIDWPTLKRYNDEVSIIRLRLFNAGKFKVLFDRIHWDGEIAPRYTQGGYDVVELRSRGDGIIRGSFFLNVPNVENDTKLLERIE